MVKRLLFSGFALATALCVTNCSTTELNIPPQFENNDESVVYDTIYANDTLMRIDTLKHVLSNIDTVKLDSIRAIVVTHNDTIYLDSITYLEDSSVVKEFEELVSMESCAEEWDGFRVNLPKSKTYICQDGIWSLYHTLEKAAVTGMAQKGPFAYQSAVSITELTLDSLNKTTNTFSDKVSGNMGEFVIPKVTLSNSYVEVEASGKFLNEITGKWSNNTIKLQAISELGSKDSTSGRDSVNVNLLTHLEYPRVKYLYQNGYSLASAKKQAQQEIMNALGLGGTVTRAEDLNLFGNRSDDGLLMAISLLFLRDQNDTTAMKNVEAFRTDIAKDGVWNDSTLKKDMADWARKFNTSDISANLSSWNIANTSSYYSYLNQFWSNKYGLGQCNSYRNDVMLQSNTAAKNSTEQYYICRYSSWYEATTAEKDTHKWKNGNIGDVQKGDITDSVYEYTYDSYYYSYKWTYSYLQTLFQICDSNKIGIIIQDSNEVHHICRATGIDIATTTEYDTYEWEDGEDGDVKSGNVNTNFIYVYDSDKGAWRKALNEIEETKGACTSTRDGETATIDEKNYTCHNGSWTGATFTFVDERDNQVYKAVKIGTQTWMAENLNFVPTAETGQSWCYAGSSPVLSTTPCSERGRYYRWNAALNKTRTSCGYGYTCSYTTPIQGSCPTGWHIPTRAEWTTLINYVSLEHSNAVYALRATTTWTSSGATDNYGFSLKAYGSNPYSNGSFSGVETYAQFWTADQSSSNYGYNISFTSSSYTTDSADKDDARNIRCVMDEL